MLTQSDGALLKNEASTVQLGRVFLRTLKGILCIVCVGKNNGGHNVTRGK